MTASGYPVACFNPGPLSIEGILTRGERLDSHVDVAVQQIQYLTRIYPNPTPNSCVVASVVKSPDPIHIIDIFGHEIISTKLSDQGMATIDLTEFSRGVYEVLLDHLGSRFTIGKIIRN